MKKSPDPDPRRKTKAKVAKQFYPLAVPVTVIVMMLLGIKADRNTRAKVCAGNLSESKVLKIQV